MSLLVSYQRKLSEFVDCSTIGLPVYSSRTVTLFRFTTFIRHSVRVSTNRSVFVLSSLVPKLVSINLRLCHVFRNSLSSHTSVWSFSFHLEVLISPVLYSDKNSRLGDVSLGLTLRYWSSPYVQLIYVKRLWIRYDECREDYSSNQDLGSYRDWNINL